MNKMIQWLKLRLVAVPRHRLKWLGSLERRLIRNRGRIEDAGDRPSVLLFSTHKCASTFLNKLLDDLSKRENRTHADPETCLATEPKLWEKLRNDHLFTDELLRRKGYYFGVFRNAFAGLPAETGQKIILVLRDPRDVLTSQFFSIAYSHPILTSAFLRKRIHALEIGIDEHVLEMSDRFVNTYSAYVREYLNRKDVLLIRYEDMISNFPEVLDKILSFIGHTNREDALAYWIRNNPFNMVREDIHKHKRKMVPGDHTEKLKEQTVEELNLRFAETLAALGYK